MECKQTGFTLIEALMAMAVIAIGLGVAVPAYSNVAAATHTGSARIDLAESLLVALNHSTLTETDVVVCASGDGVDCSGSADWSQGWIAFADIDENRARGPNETLLRRQPRLEGGTHLRSTAQRTRIVFQPHGGAAAEKDGAPIQKGVPSNVRAGSSLARSHSSMLTVWKRESSAGWPATENLHTGMVPGMSVARAQALHSTPVRFQFAAAAPASRAAASVGDAAIR